MPDALSRRPDYKQRGSDAVVPALLKLGSDAVRPDALSRNYRQGSEKMPDALPKKPDYMLNVMQALASHEEYVTYMEEYLISGALPKNKFNEQVRLEAPHFLIEEGRLMRRIAEGVTAPYLEWEFRGDLIQRMHEEYGHLSQQGMRDLVRTRVWWPKMDQDVREFVKSCPNCQRAQRQKPGQEREYAQLPTHCCLRTVAYAQRN